MKNRILNMHDNKIKSETNSAVTKNCGLNSMGASLEIIGCRTRQMQQTKTSIYRPRQGGLGCRFMIVMLLFIMKQRDEKIR